MLHELDETGHTVGQKWCGPAALSILTGVPLRDTKALAARVAGETYTSIEGMWEEEMVLALHQLGYGSRKIPVYERYHKTTPCGPTLRRFLREREPLETVQPMLIAVEGHFLCAHMHYLADNSTGRPVRAECFPKQGRLVKWAANVFPI